MTDEQADEAAVRILDNIDAHIDVLSTGLDQ